MSSQHLDVVVIGAGQAGLSIGYYLQQSNLNYLIIDSAKEIGDSWKYRYDSLKLFTPRNYSSLPGMDFLGDPNGYPTKDEVVSYLQSYAKTFKLKAQLNTFIEKLNKTKDGYSIQTNSSIINSKQVVIATGPFQTPFIPHLEGTVSKEIQQIHTSEYQNPSQILGKKVLIVGAGNSGAQIAVELTKTHDVSISARSSIIFRPYTILGKSLFWWIDKIGVLNASKHSFKGKKFRAMGDPVIGLELKQLFKSAKVKLKSGTVKFNNDAVVFSDGSEERYDSIIWATGFRHDYSWINIPNIVDNKNIPIERRGITNSKGLYFLGLSWMHSRNSALIGGVGIDAKYLIQEILNHI